MAIWRHLNGRAVTVAGAAVRKTWTRCVVAFCCDGQRKPGCANNAASQSARRSPEKTADVICALWIDRHKSAPHKQTHVPGVQLLRLRLDFRVTQCERASLGPPVIGEASDGKSRDLKHSLLTFFSWNKHRLNTAQHEDAPEADFSFRLIQP